ncbi:MAG: hypothetical protein WCP79_12045 [Bacillota bacterium]
MKYLRKFRANNRLGNRGFSLPIVLGIIGLICGLLLGYMSTSRSELGSTQAFYESATASNFAECGARAALSKLNDTTYYSNSNKAKADVSIDPAESGKYRVLCYNPTFGLPSYDANKRAIESTGLGSGSVSRTLVLNPITCVPPWGNMSDFALFTVGGATLTGSASIVGSVATNGTLNLDWSTHVTGNAAGNTIVHAAALSVAISGTATTSYNCAGLAALKPASDTSSTTVLRRSTYSALAHPTGATLTGSDYSYPWHDPAPVITGGNYYCPGKLSFSDSQVVTGTGPVLIYAVGDIHLGGSGHLGKSDGTGGDFMLITEGNILIDGDAKAYNTIAIAGGTITVSGSGALTGSAISFSSTPATFSGVGLTYDAATFALFPTVIAGLSVTSPGWSGGTAMQITIGGYSYQ